jgi:hypothetical protein
MVASILFRFKHRSFIFSSFLSFSPVSFFPLRISIFVMGKLSLASLAGMAHVRVNVLCKNITFISGMDSGAAVGKASYL